MHHFDTHGQRDGVRELHGQVGIEGNGFDAGVAGIVAARPVVVVFRAQGEAGEHAEAEPVAVGELAGVIGVGQGPGATGSCDHFQKPKFLNNPLLCIEKWQ